MDLKAIRARLRADAKLPAPRRSFFLRPRGRARGAVLLLHGYSACPYELLDFGRFLAGSGYLAYAPRLAGHGQGTASFNSHGRQDWLATARGALAELGAGKRPVLLVGHSMGGVLAAILAAERPEKVRRLVLAAPAFLLADPWASLSTLAPLRWLIPRLHVPALHPDSRHWTLDYASHRVAELVRLGREGTRAAQALRLPLFMLQAKVDDQVSRPFNQALFPRIPSAQKRLWIYDAAEHNVFHRYNPLQKEAFAAVLAFLSGRVATARPPL